VFALQEKNDQIFIVDFIANAIITDANPVLIVRTFHLEHSIRAWVFGELLDSAMRSDQAI
jgi:hypothetical protein